MASNKEAARPQQEATKSKRFRIDLGWRGLISLFLVSCCLFFWMFLLGLWAGQTILPASDPSLTDKKMSSAAAQGDATSKRAGQARIKTDS